MKFQVLRIEIFSFENNACNPSTSLVGFNFRLIQLGVEIIKGR